MREGLLTLPRLKLELRTDHSRLALVGVFLLMAIIASFAVGMILLAILGRSPMRVSNAFFIQPFTSLYGIGEILLKTGPLLLIAQGCGRVVEHALALQHEPDPLRNRRCRSTSLAATASGGATMAPSAIAAAIGKPAKRHPKNARSAISRRH